MRNATRVTVSTFGVLAAIAGIEHGAGEVGQGNVAPPGPVFESWAGSELFQILAGEPAMTLLPNLLLSGILTILVSLIFFVWAVFFVERKHGGPVLIGLSLLLLLVGGGFGPPLLGIILGITATRIHSPLRWWQAHLPAGLRHVLATVWPWLYAAAIIAWLFLFPGLILLDYFAGIGDESLVVSLTIFSAFSLLLLTIVASFARDLQQQVGARPAAALAR